MNYYSLTVEKWMINLLNFVKIGVDKSLKNKARLDRFLFVY